MTVNLTGLRVRRMDPVAMRFGGALTPELGGPVQQIERVGSRWSFNVETQAMALEPDGRRWSALLTRATREGAILPIAHSAWFTIGAPGAPVVGAATAAGRFVPIAGAQPGYAIRQGQWVTFVVAGVRYSDQIFAPTVVAGDGTAMLELQNLIRVPLVMGGAVKLARPEVEGIIASVEGWTVDTDEEVSFAFTIAEMA